MIAYASRTGTRRNLAALRAAGWRLLVSAAGELRSEGFRYALDNGAWSAFQAGTGFDAAAFETAVETLGAGADWVVAPDIVEGGAASLEMSVDWIPWLLDRCPRVLVAVQDGVEVEHLDGLARYLGPRVGLAIGGSTGWKEETLATRRFTGLCRGMGAHIHVLRVNSARRIALCAWAGADSFDGSGPSRFSKCLPRLDAARRQGVLWGL